MSYEGKDMKQQHPPYEKTEQSQFGNQHSRTMTRAVISIATTFSEAQTKIYFPSKV